MDAKVDDFLNEINEIAPPHRLSTDECGKYNIYYYNSRSTDVFSFIWLNTVYKLISVWKECQDELTGFSYYWNTKTDEVTWTPPPDFKNQTKQDYPIIKTNNVTLPPRSIKDITPPQSTKIYTVQEDSRKVLKVDTAKKPQKRTYKQNSDSEDE